MTVLDPHYRGDEFRYVFTLKDGWLGAQFTGGVFFTLRREVPPSTVTNDAGALCKVSTLSGEITFVGAVGTVVIPGPRNKLWPLENLRWELRGIINGTPHRPLKLDNGTIQIEGDLMRG